MAAATAAVVDTAVEDAVVATTLPPSPLSVEVVIALAGIIPVPLTTGFSATMGKFWAAKRVVVAPAPGAAERNPNPETGSAFPGTADEEGEEAVVF